jgi:hypothetical protein
VNNLPAVQNGYSWGATLMNQEQQPLASGQLRNGKGVFYHVKSKQDPQPNLTKPFNTDGSYYVAISQARLATFEPDMTTTSIHLLPIVFNKENQSYIFNYNTDFIPLKPVDVVDPTQFKLTVTNLGKPKNMMWGASLMTGTTLDTVVATAAYPDKNGTFTFCAPYTSGLMAGGPDASKPYSTVGEYYIGLSDVTISDRNNPDNAFILYEGDKPMKVTFNQDKPVQTFARGNFKTASGENPGDDTPIDEKPESVQFKLIINELGESADGVLQVLLLTDVRAHVISAIGVNFGNDTFLFFARKTDGTPDLAKPFSTKRSAGYFVGLSSNQNNPSDTAILFEGDTMKRIIFDIKTAPECTVEKTAFKKPIWFTMNITNLVGQNGDWKVHLMADSAPDSEIVAAGNVNNQEITFWHPTSNGSAEITKPFNTANDYYVSLTELGSFGTVKNKYILCEGNTPSKVRFDSDNLIQTVTKADFKLLAVE